MATPIDYLDPPYVLLDRPPAWMRAGLQETASGYGRRLNSGYMLQRDGDRLRRVYVICYSNSGTLYVLVKGKPVYLRSHEADEARELGREK